MRAGLDVAMRLAVAGLALITIAAASGCGGGGGGSGKKNGGPSEIAFTQGALRSVPLVKPPAPVGAARLVGAPVAPISIDEDGFTKLLFKMECRRPASEHVDYCPVGTPPASDYGSGLGQDPYGFDMQALVGFIYHAQMYTGLVTDCSGLGFTPRNVTSGSYQAFDSSNPTADPPPNPTRFIFDQYSTYACQTTNVTDTAHETRMVSAIADGSYQTTLHTRYKYVAGGDPQTDFFQVDVTMNAGTPEFLAFNFASAAPHSSRLVLLVNLTSHRFAMKYYTPEQPGGDMTAPERYAVAAGTAGYDLATGQPNAGNYYIHFHDDPGEFSECVNNADGSFQLGFTACDADLDHAAWSPSAIQTFLNVPTATAARIVDYLDVFDGTADLAIADEWDVTTDQAADADLYWPASLN